MSVWIVRDLNNGGCNSIVFRVGEHNDIGSLLTDGRRSGEECAQRRLLAGLLANPFVFGAPFVNSVEDELPALRIVELLTKLIGSLLDACFGHSQRRQGRQGVVISGGAKDSLGH